MNLLAALASLVIVSLSPAPSSAAEWQAEFVAASTVPLDNPHDLKLSPDGKYLFVSDVGNNRVAVLDPDTLAWIGEFGGDHQSGTHDIDFDAAGRAYVADTHNNRVTIYRMAGPEGTLIGELKERLRGPEGVLAHPNGRIYVAGAWSGNVVAYDNGKVVGELGGLSSPHDLERAPDGRIWLADAGNDRMLLLTPDLAIVRELKGPPYDFRGVRYQDVLADGTLIAADKNNHQVKVIAPDGRLLLVLGTGRPEEGPGKFTTPEGVETRDETLWIADSGNDRVVKYRLRSR
jgi:DNA-binding beta-propeller fold protein YncE